MIFVRQRRARGVIGRLSPGASAADVARVATIGQRETAAAALRVGEKVQFAPEFGLNDTRAIDDRV